MGGECLAQGDLQDIANFGNFRILTLLTDYSGAANTIVELLPRSRSSRDPELWRACQACHEAQAVAVGAGCLAQGDLQDIANFGEFRVLDFSRTFSLGKPRLRGRVFHATYMISKFR